MKAKVVGIQKLHFTNSNGEEINGTNVYCAFPDENVEGLRTEKFFLKEGISLPENTKVNDFAEFSFNMKGKVEAVYKVN